GSDHAPIDDRYRQYRGARVVVHRGFPGRITECGAEITAVTTLGAALAFVTQTVVLFDDGRLAPGASAAIAGAAVAASAGTGAERIRDGRVNALTVAAGVRRTLVVIVAVGVDSALGSTPAGSVAPGPAAPGARTPHAASSVAVTVAVTVTVAVAVAV